MTSDVGPRLITAKDTKEFFDDILGMFVRKSHKRLPKLEVACERAKAKLEEWWSREARSPGTSPGATSGSGAHPPGSATTKLSSTSPKELKKHGSSKAGGSKRGALAAPTSPVHGSSEALIRKDSLMQQLGEANPSFSTRLNMSLSTVSRQMFPSASLVYCINIAMDNAYDKKWSMKKESRINIIKSSIVGISALAEGGWLRDTDILDEIPGSATGVGKNLVQVSLELLVQYAGSKRVDLATLVLRAIETTIRTSYTSSNSTLLQVVAQCLFRLHICSPLAEIRNAANTSLQNCLLCIHKSIEDAHTAQRNTTVLPAAAAALICASLACTLRPRERIPLETVIAAAAGGAAGLIGTIRSYDTTANLRQGAPLTPRGVGGVAPAGGGAQRGGGSSSVVPPPPPPSQLRSATPTASGFSRGHSRVASAGIPSSLGGSNTQIDPPDSPSSPGSSGGAAALGLRRGDGSFGSSWGATGGGGVPRRGSVGGVESGAAAAAAVALDLPLCRARSEPGMQQQQQQAHPPPYATSKQPAATSAATGDRYSEIPGDFEEEDPSGLCDASPCGSPGVAGGYPGGGVRERLRRRNGGGGPAADPTALLTKLRDHAVRSELRDAAAAGGGVPLPVSPPTPPRLQRPRLHSPQEGVIEESRVLSPGSVTKASIFDGDDLYTEGPPTPGDHPASLGARGQEGGGGGRGVDFLEKLQDSVRSRKGVPPVPFPAPGVSHRPSLSYFKEVHAASAVVVSEADLAKDLAMTRPAEHDAYKILKTLCALSMDDISKETESDSPKVLGRIFALELTCTMVSRSGEGFARSSKLMGVLKHHLASTITANMASTRPHRLFECALKVFNVCLRKFQRFMRAELVTILCRFILPIARSPTTSFQQRAAVLGMLRSHVPNILSLFLNNDCGSDGADVTSEILHTVAFLAVHDFVRSEWVTLPQAKLIRYKAALILVEVVELLKVSLEELESDQGIYRQAAHSAGLGSEFDTAQSETSPQRITDTAMTPPSDTALRTASGPDVVQQHLSLAGGGGSGVGGTDGYIFSPKSAPSSRDDSSPGALLAPLRLHGAAGLKASGFSRPGHSRSQSLGAVSVGGGITSPASPVLPEDLTINSNTASTVPIGVCVAPSSNPPLGSGTAAAGGGGGGGGFASAAPHHIRQHSDASSLMHGGFGSFAGSAFSAAATGGTAAAGGGAGAGGGGGGLIAMRGDGPSPPLLPPPPVDVGEGCGRAGEEEVAGEANEGLGVVVVPASLLYIPCRATHHFQSYSNKWVIRSVVSAWHAGWKKGIKLLVDFAVLPDRRPATVADFLFENGVKYRLDPSQTGDLLLRNASWNRCVLTEYLQRFSMKGVSLDQATRELLGQFLPCGESQIIDRLMMGLVAEYTAQNEHHPMVSPDGKFRKGLSVMLPYRLLHEVPAVPEDGSPTLVHNGTHHGSSGNTFADDLASSTATSLTDRVETCKSNPGRDRPFDPTTPDTSEGHRGGNDGVGLSPGSTPASSICDGPAYAIPGEDFGSRGRYPVVATVLEDAQAADGFLKVKVGENFVVCQDELKEEDGGLPGSSGASRFAGRVMEVPKEQVLKLDFIYLVGMTVLIVNTQTHNRNVGKAEQQSLGSLVTMLATEAEGVLTAAACEEILSPVQFDEIKLDPAFSEPSRYEVLREVHESWTAWKEAQAKERKEAKAAKGPDLALGKLADWREKESLVEISPHPMQVSDLPLNKAAAKAYLKGTSQLRETTLTVLRSGAHVAGPYFESPARREHVPLLVQAMWPCIAVAFDKVLASSDDLQLLEKVPVAYRTGSRLCGELGLDADMLREDKSNTSRTLHRWGEFHGVRSFAPPKTHPVPTLSLLHNFLAP